MTDFAATAGEVPDSQCPARQATDLASAAALPAAEARVATAGR